MPPDASDRVGGERTGRRATHIAFAIGLAVVAAVYATGFRNGFVWLDHTEILDGRLVVRSVGEALALLGDDRNAPGYFRPVYNVLHSIDLALWGRRAVGFHLSSLLLHLATAWLLRGIALRLGVDGRAATLGVLLWATHPIALPAVGLIHAKADLAAAAGMAASFAFFLARGGRWRIVASCAALAVALYAKETAYLFAFALIPFARALEARRSGARAWIAALVAVTLAAGVHRALVVSPSAYESALGVPERAATFVTVYVQYVGKLLWPAFPSIADTTVRFGALGVGARVGHGVAFVALVAAQAWLFARRPSSRPFLVLFHVALLPVAQIVPILHFRADRFLYIPSIGFVGAVLCALLELGRRVPAFAGAARAQGRWIGVWTAILVVAAAHGVATLRSFGDDRTLMGRELRREPRYREGLAGLARDAEFRGDWALSERLYAMSVAPDPRIVSYVDLDAVVVNRTNVLLRLGRFDEAAKWSATLLDDVVGREARTLARYNQAVALLRLGRASEALPGLLAFVASHPADARAVLLTGEAAAAIGDTALARAHFTRYLESAPTAPDRAAVEKKLAELGP